MKKIISRCMAVLLTVAMILTMSMTAFASEGTSKAVAAATGKLTVNNTVAGKKLDLYQIFTAVNANGSVLYTLNTAYKEFFNGKVTVSDDSDETFSKAAYEYVKTQVGEDTKESNGATFAKELLTWILDSANNITAFKENVETTETITEITGLPYGYYLVYPEGATDTSSAPGGQGYTSVASLVSVTGDDAQINMKSNYPTVDKKLIPAQSGSGLTVGDIVNSSWESIHQGELEDENDAEDTIAPHGVATGESKNAADFAIGGTVTYQLTSKVPDMTGYNSYTFNFIDTLSKGLDLKEILSVKVGDKELKAGATGDYTYLPTYATNSDGTDGTHTLTIKFNDFYKLYKDLTGTSITVVYTATLNKDAVIGMNPNTNKAIVEYSNKPGTDETGKSKPSEVDVHTFDFKIFKHYLTGETKNPLEGAEFELYKANTEENNKVKIIRDADGTYRQATPEEAKVEGFEFAVIKSGTDGYAHVKGLEAGTYFLRETRAPEGYNKLTGDIKITITAVYDENSGKLTKYFVTYKYGDADEITGVDITTVDNHPEVPVENKAGAQLPSTGSKGALMVTLAGIVLFGALTVSKAFRKRKAD
ncbi:isopeptide-forming domain-containing fimbrial protein [Ruminococcus sp. AM18-15]|nr:isopeptide-forming domain-containing fimbrial protein [Ruminococcus sp. AM18-44]RHO28413.1 isopeptide-forming domain-containing fimbrial protein [Ruminococcus sp. AM18-15]